MPFEVGREGKEVGEIVNRPKDGEQPSPAPPASMPTPQPTPIPVPAPASAPEKVYMFVFCTNGASRICPEKLEFRLFRCKMHEIWSEGAAYDSLGLVISSGYAGARTNQS